jgi:hypothetical protein
MKLEELLKSEATALPRSGFSEASQTFDGFLAKAFDDYLVALRSLDDQEFPNICSEVVAAISKTEELSCQIVAAVKSHLNGYPHCAFSDLEKSLANIPIDNLFSTLSRYVELGQPRGHLASLLNSMAHPPLYRLRSDRAAASTSRLSRKEIFHIPFEQRHLVENQRYSIAGLPCLYLGSSLWICWEELGRPELDTVLVSRFVFAKETKILDFRFPPQIIWQACAFLRRVTQDWVPGDATLDIVLDDFNKRFSEKSIAAYILCWPLIAACSIRVDFRKGPFFPQFIVPQLLLQWITQSEKVDGIRYFSTRVPSADANAYSNSNFVFPARNIQRTGLCSHLNGIFNMTAPIAWDMLQATNLGNIFDFGPSNAEAGIRLSDDMFISYHLTAFHRAEVLLGRFEEDPQHSKPASS